MDPVGMGYSSREVWGISTSNSPRPPFLQNHALYITHSLVILGLIKLPSHACLLFLHLGADVGCRPLCLLNVVSVLPTRQPNVASFLCVPGPALRHPGSPDGHLLTSSWCCYLASLYLIQAGFKYFGPRWPSILVLTSGQNQTARPLGINRAARFR